MTDGCVQQGRRLSWRSVSWLVLGLCWLVALGGCDKGEPGPDATTLLDVPFDAEPEVVAATDVVIPDLGIQDTGPSCPGAAGCSCAADGDCVSGLCVETAAGRVCASLCTSECPPGFVCRSAPLGGDPVSYCAPSGVRQCAPCNTKADCNAQWSVAAECVDAGTAGSFCATSCNVLSDCPQGASCVDVPGKGKLCTPTGGMGACTCSDWAKDNAASTQCDVLEGTQACPGVRSCGAEGLSACTKLDGEPCADAGCKEAKDGSACDDGDPCTQSECKAGVCSATTNFCQCQQSSDCADDGNLCNGAPFCDKSAIPYTCKTNPATVVTCPAATKPCTTQVCNPATGQCSEAALGDGLTCDDGDPCFANRTCLGGQCQGGIQTCACLQTADCAALENGNLCDGTLYCDLITHTCKVNPASVVQCPAPSGPCAKVVCLPESGQCNEVALPDASACEDGAACTVGDYCSAGSCVAGTVTCNCAQDADCAPYEDGDACNGLLFCNKAVGKCQVNPKTVVQCPKAQDTECRTNTCDQQTGACAMAFSPTSTLCEDGNPCTASDHCEQGECVSTEDICPCEVDADCESKEDGNLCNGTLYCDLISHTCAVNPATVVSCPFAGNNPCAPIVCNPTSGSCEASPVLSGSCDDGDACTAAGTCVAGVCKPGPNLCQCKTSADCLPYDDNNACNGTLYCDVQVGLCKPNLASIPVCPPTTDACSQNSCDPAVGGCVVTAAKDGTWCSDGQNCTKGDACAAGKCQPGALVCDCLTTADCASKEDGNLCNGTLICDTSGPAPSCVLNPSSVVTCPDGGDTCTDPVCLPVTGTCTQVPAEGVCTDGNACTSGDVCADGACVPGGALPCNDNNPCTDDSCNSGSGCVFLPNNLPCDDGSACTTVDTCIGSSCIGSVPVVCTAKDACHDVGTCDPASGTCSEPAKPDGSGCDDGDQCTQSDTCVAGSCVGASPVVCSALDQCHEAGSCNSATGTCSNPAKQDGTTCDDGNACTQTDTCLLGSCSGGNAVVCSAQDQCHQTGSCDPATGVCSNPLAPNGFACSDGNLCTLGDSCQSGSCQPGTPETCAPSDVCHDAGTCDPGTGQCSQGPANTATCDDGNPCTLGDVCAAGQCVGGAAKPCPASDQCHDPGVCNPATGVCSDPAKTNGTACDDGNGCTINDACVAGTCWSTTPKPCLALDQCHDAGTCNPANGLCSNPAKQDGTGCNDGDACTQSDACQTGSCVGSNPVVCTALDQCHDAGSCNPLSGQCSNPNKSDGTGCSDGNACTQADTCVAGSCTGASPVVCTALDQCHDPGTCNTTTGLCSNPNKANGSGCNDGDGCTKTDACQSGTCQGTNPVVCAALDQCHTIGSCNPATGQCSNPNAPDSTACSDGSACTDNDTCQSGACTAGSAVACDDSNPCTTDSCVPATGCKFVANTLPCDDGSLCTEQDTCAGGACLGAALACGDNNRYTVDSCDPSKGCSNKPAEICNGIDDDNNGSVDNVTCGGLACTCEDGVTRCQSGCTVCPDPDDVAIGIDDGGTARVMCAPSWPRWGMLPDAPTSYTQVGDGTVLDHATGLQWEQTVGASTFGWAAAAGYCNSLTLGGKTDWRLPTTAELASLVDLSTNAAPAISPYAFPSTPTTLHWTAETLRSAGVRAWSVSGNNGSQVSYDIAATNFGRVRCVRSVSSPARPSVRWQVDDSMGLVFDLRTGLQWQRSPSPTGGANGNGLFTHSAAVAACDGLVLGGHDDWRLPSLREAQSILDLQKTTAPAYDSQAFPTSPAGTFGYVWTSTIYGFGATSAWVVEYGSSAGTSPRDLGDAYALRCVRKPVCGDNVCDPGEANLCAFDCGCTTALNWQPCNDGNACTIAETCQNGVCTGTTSTSCYDGWAGSTDGCNPATGCTFAWPEVCNGKDDDLDGTTDDVQCGAMACSCDGGVTVCPTGCTTCPNPDDIAIEVATGTGSKVICAHDYPAWGILPDRPNALQVAGAEAVQDTRTGLIWQRLMNASAMSGAEALSHCNSATDAGYDDWRLPTLAELSTLLDLTAASGPAVVPGVFLNVSDGQFWTASRQGSSGANLLTVSFWDADVDSLAVGSIGPYALCVRSPSGPAVSPQRWSKSSSGSSIYDNATGLRWEASPPLSGGDGTGKFSYADAVNYCAARETDGYDNWRLPSLREMWSLLRMGKAAPPYADTEAFPSLPTSGGQNYWTSTPYFATGSSMWLVNTSSGHTTQGVLSNLFRPLCVRVPICGDNVCEDPEKSSCVSDCGCTPQLEGAACNDGLPCTAGDSCTSGSCVSSGPTNCDDHNPCTSDSCVGASGCSYTPVSNPCDDGSLCTTDDSCSAGACVGVMLNCDDGWPESADSCNPTLGKCEHSWPETCNGADDNLDGQVDNVTCAGGSSCSCVNGVQVCPSSCSTCPNPHDRAVLIDDGGTSRVVCVHDYPAWGINALAPTAYIEGGDGTIRDPATGLQWQKTQSATSYNASDAQVYCDGLDLGSKTDWRLPTAAELESLVDYVKASGTAINTTSFPSTASTSTVTLTPLNGSSTQMAVQFSNGQSFQVPTSNNQRVRCVRAEASVPTAAQRWTKIGTLLVSDLATGLIWMRNPPTTGGDGSGQFIWTGAESYCTNLSHAGYDDWRLPSVRELASLRDFRRSTAPWVDPLAFNLPATGFDYWTATGFQSGTAERWVVDFSSAVSVGPLLATTNNRVLCVRSPTCGDNLCSIGESATCPTDCD